MQPHKAHFQSGIPTILIPRAGFRNRQSTTQSGIVDEDPESVEGIIPRRGVKDSPNFLCHAITDKMSDTPIQISSLISSRRSRIYRGRPL